MMLASYVQANGAAVPVNTSSLVNSSTDDYEENMDGSVGPQINSSDLDMGDNTPLLRVAMRFTGLNIPQGATITNAYIQFSGERTLTGPSPTIEIVGEDADNPVTFARATSNALNRPKTTARITWNSIPSWTLDQRDADLQTPDLSTIIQEIVDRAGYTSASAIALFAESLVGVSTDSRNGKSWDNSPSEAPELFVTYAN